MRLDVRDGCPVVAYNTACALIAQLETRKGKEVESLTPVRISRHPEPIKPESPLHVSEDGSISRGLETMWFSMCASDEVDSMGPAIAVQEDCCVYDLDWTCLPGSEGSTTPLRRDGLAESGLSLRSTVGVGLDG